LDQVNDDDVATGAALLTMCRRALVSAGGAALPLRRWQGKLVMR
jgi:hypothetical protein